MEGYGQQQQQAQPHQPPHGGGGDRRRRGSNSSSSGDDDDFDKLSPEQKAKKEKLCVPALSLLPGRSRA